MSLIGVCRKIATVQVSTFLRPATATVQSERNVWGNVNKPNPRSRHHRPNRHWDPKNKGLRRAKDKIIALPDIDEERKLQNTGDVLKMREKMKKRGILPTYPQRETSLYLACTVEPMDRYIPPEGEGKASLFSKDRIKGLSYDPAKQKGKTYLAVRTIRKYEPDFDPRTFVHEAQDIYIDAHKALAERKTKQLKELVTEDCYPKMMLNATRNTIYWDFIKSLEPPSVVHVRKQEVLSKDNIFAQVTVRFHSQQILAIYDRFGRLVHGHPHVAKDVLEYVVFEKHVANVYGTWRMHTKIVPEWLRNQRSDSGILTHPLNKQDIEETNKSEEKAENKEDDESEENVIHDDYGNIVARPKKR